MIYVALFWVLYSIFGGLTVILVVSRMDEEVRLPHLGGIMIVMLWWVFLAVELGKMVTRRKK